MRINDSEPSQTFATAYLQQAKRFLEFASNTREQLIGEEA
jgi:hypothetical protein